MTRYRFFSFILAFLIGFPVFAAQERAKYEWSARRPGEPWQKSLARYRSSRSFGDAQFLASHRSAQRSARPYRTGVDLSNLPYWNGSFEEMVGHFWALRDERIYFSRSRPSFARRSTWLYPDDGCFARAWHSAKYFERLHERRPGKIFAFGNLKLKTPYSRNGAVYWWFHVVAAYRLGDEAWVLDPAVEPVRPLRLAEWLQRISSRIGDVRVAACDTYAYGPSSYCAGGSSNQERGGRSHQISYLSSEWNRLVALRLNPERLLGDHPPWRTGVEELD